MKKIFLLTLLSLILISCTSNQENTNTTTTTTSILVTQPERKMDVYGKVIAIEWNEITLSQVDTSKDPTFNMTMEEKKKYMTSLDETARMALKEEINSAILWEVKLTIPVWIGMTKKESQWTDAPLLEASLADLKIWWYISVWLDTTLADRKIAEFVKLSFTQ
jgi:hypothetical protein